jgi:butyrate kinase
MDYSILVINPGSTSDDIAFFRGNKLVFSKVVRYTPADLAHFDGKKITSQFEFRKKVVMGALRENGIELSELNAVIGRGGVVKPIPGGTYAMNDALSRDLTEGVMGDHASNLGGLIAAEIAREAKVPSFIADPVVVDELEPLARYSGMPENPRVSIFHALNQKCVARMAAARLGKKYEDCRLIVMHAGGGVSVGAHINGKIVDVNNALEGDGPFTPQRSGGVPSGGLVKMCFSGKYTQTDIKLKIKGRGGLVAYTGTSDLVALEKYIETGETAPGSGIDPAKLSRAAAKECIEAMAYQMAKEICSLSAVLKGRIDAIVLTGGIAYSVRVMSLLEERISWLAPVFKFPGGDEKSALRDAALRALKDPSTVQTYS